MREFILGKLELFLANHLSKAVLAEVLRESARDLGEGAITPTTMKQFKKLTAYLDGEVTFYAACCRPYDRHAKTCDVCGQDLWIGKRPRHVFFVRSVKAWLADLLAVPALKAAIDQYRKRKSEDGVIADVLDGQVAKDLMQKGTQAVRKVLKFFFL